MNKLMQSKKNRCNTFYNLIERPKNSIGSELGVFQGYFSQTIMEIIKPKELHLIDAWEICKKPPKNPGKNAWWSFSQEQIDMCFESVSETFKDKEQVFVHKTSDGLSVLPDDYLDWAYIDALHDYESVKKDLNDALKNVKKGGWIAGDDYIEIDMNDKSVTKELIWFVGVKKAVDEFAKIHGFSVRVGPYSQFAMKMI